MTSVSEANTIAANQAAVIAAKKDTLTGSASENLTQAQFLKLLTEQLQYQDPMQPTDNAQMVSQVNSFSQLSAQNDMSATLASSQAGSYVGATVNVKDPKDSSKTITGVVVSAELNGTNSSLKLNNGVSYPLSSVKSVQLTQVTTGQDNSSTQNTSGT